MVTLGHRDRIYEIWLKTQKEHFQWLRTQKEHFQKLNAENVEIIVND